MRRLYNFALFVVGIPISAITSLRSRRYGEEMGVATVDARACRPAASEVNVLRSATAPVLLWPNSRGGHLRDGSTCRTNQTPVQRDVACRLPRAP